MAQQDHAALRERRDVMWGSVDGGDDVDLDELATLDGKIEARAQIIPVLTEVMVRHDQAALEESWRQVEADTVGEYRVRCDAFAAAYQDALRVMGDLVAAGAAIDRLARTFRMRTDRPSSAQPERWSPLTTVEGVRIESAPTGDAILAAAGWALKEAPGQPWGQYSEQFHMIRQNLIMPGGL